MQFFSKLSSIIGALMLLMLFPQITLAGVPLSEPNGEVWGTLLETPRWSEDGWRRGFGIGDVIAIPEGNISYTIENGVLNGLIEMVNLGQTIVSLDFLGQSTLRMMPIVDTFQPVAGGSSVNLKTWTFSISENDLLTKFESFTGSKYQYELDEGELFMQIAVEGVGEERRYFSAQMKTRAENDRRISSIGQKYRCSQILPGDSVWAGFGAPYSYYSDDPRNLLEIYCSTKSTVAPHVRVHDLGSNQWTYKYGYYWQNEQWQRFEYTPVDSSATESGVWISGDVKGSVPIVIGDSSNRPAYYLAYVCSEIDGAWKCGCQNKQCSRPTWQIQGFES